MPVRAQRASPAEAREVRVRGLFRGGDGIGGLQTAVRPCGILLAAEDELQQAALHELLVGDEAAIERFAVEQHILEKACLLGPVYALDGEGFSIGQVEDGSIDEGPA